jgi:crossover junction endodeoxyribonuclease RusA
MDRLVLNDVPPSVNHMYRNVTVNGRRMKVLTPLAQRWFDNTVITANLWRSKNKWPTAKGKVIVRLWYFFPDLRKRDTHNGLKALLDALEDARIYENDKYALPWVMDFQVDRDYPRVEIELSKSLWM